MTNFGIPEKVGEYDVNVGKYSVHVNIYKMFERMSRTDLIGTRGTIGGYNSILGHDVIVTDEQGNVVSSRKGINEKYFTEFMESLYREYMDINPDKLAQKVRNFICYSNGRNLVMPIGGIKIQKIGDDFIKALYYIDKSGADIDQIISELSNIGCTVKRLKDKGVRSYSCFVLSIIIPKQLNLSEGKINKKLIKITESDLHKIILESLKQIL